MALRGKRVAVLDPTVYGGYLDSGGMYVVLSRHRVACFVVARAGIEDLLLRCAPWGGSCRFPRRGRRCQRLDAAM